MTKLIKLFQALKSSSAIVLHPGRNTITLDLPPQQPGSYVLGVLTGQIGQLRFRSHGFSKVGPADSDDFMSYEKPAKPILKVAFLLMLPLPTIHKLFLSFTLTVSCYLYEHFLNLN